MVKVSHVPCDGSLLLPPQHDKLLPPLQDHRFGLKTTLVVVLIKGQYHNVMNQENDNMSYTLTIASRSYTLGSTALTAISSKGILIG
jgi:hypothetical protein